MSAPDVVTGVSSWPEANQQYLSVALDWLRALLAAEPGDAWPDPRAALVDDGSLTPALEGLGALFGLSSFERDLLLLCAAVELDATIARLVRERTGTPHVTFSLALALLPEAHWSALLPARPLRSWRLLEPALDGPLTASALRIDERILHEIAGAPYLDSRLAGIVEQRSPGGLLVPSHAALAEQVARAWQAESGDDVWPLVQLCGPDADAQLEIAAHAAGLVGLTLHVADARLLPAGAGELAALQRLWEREAALTRAALAVDCHDAEPDDPRGQAVGLLAERVRTPLALATRDRRAIRRRAVVTLDVRRPAREEQRELWHAALAAHTPLNGEVDLLVDGLDLAPLEIAAAGADARARLSDDAGSFDLALTLWDAGRRQARPRLEDLAARIEPAASWDDLVLPAGQLATLREIALHVRHRATVEQAWGFAGRGSRGLGLSALFSGASGTGKTTAAEVLANELRLDLYRIDLSAVVSKYIGETEKNLRRIFDAAEGGGAILLFDEADALFGKRSEVRDSHDRYANIEVSYLLQRMEAYRGLAVLTTNLRGAIDPAFTRRIRFIVPFPFPDAGQRAEIWRRAFPGATPTDKLQVARLAQLNVAGGNIRNIALSAAFLAAADRSPVTMRHLLAAARGEYAKIDKALTPSEIEGWLT